MSKKILANDGIDNIGKAILEKAGFIVITEKVSQENLIQEINEKGYVALTVRSATKVRKDIIDACSNLKVIGRGGVGMDNIDVEYAREKGINVINTPAASSNSVAELVFAHLFNALRFLYDSNRKMPLIGDTKFDELKKKYSKGIELRGKSIGIIGFGMKVIAYDPFINESSIEIDIDGLDKKITLKIITTSLDQLIKNSDFITCHVPGGSIITKKEIEQMKDGVILINTSRGGVINEKDLLDGLDSGKIAQACLDVFESEPIPADFILKHQNISLTPHIGAATIEAQERIGLELAEKIIAALI